MRSLFDLWKFIGKSQIIRDHRDKLSFRTERQIDRLRTHEWLPPGGGSAVGGGGACVAVTLAKTSRHAGSLRHFLRKCHRLAAARSRSGSDTTVWCHSLPSRRFATSRREAMIALRYPLSELKWRPPHPSAFGWHLLRWRRLWDGQSCRSL